MMMPHPMGQPTPEQFEAIEHAAAVSNAQEVAQSRVSPAKRLQNALRALGVAQGDPTLSRLKVDGIIGAGTLKAMNYALSTYIGGGRAMTLAQVRQSAAALADQVSSYVESHGGVVPPVSAPARRVSSSMLPSIPTAPAALVPSSTGLPFDSKYIWWGVAGFSVLIVLSMVASVTRRRREAQPQES